MNIVDIIVAVVLITPLIYGALHYRGRWTSNVADQIVRDLDDRSKRDSRPESQ
jgi:hypothetical protein